MKNFGINKWIKDNTKELVIIFFFLCLNILFLNYFSHLYTIQLWSKKYLLLLGLSIIVELTLSSIVIKSKTQRWTIEKLFLFLFIPIGLIYMLSIPIGRVPDEADHLVRAYGISNGHFIALTNENGDIGEYLPASFSRLTRANMSYNNNEVDNNDSFVFMKDSGSALYNFINYIPQSLGILIGRILHLPAIFIAYLGRLFNFTCFIALFYFAIKQAPFGKYLLFFIAFLPIVLQEAISLSADCLAISTSAAFISYTFYLTYNKTSKLDKKTYSTLIALLTLQSLCKIVYLPFCFLIFLIPRKKFKSKKSYLLKTILPISIIIIVNLIWLKIASQYLIENNPGVNSSEQIKYIFSSPLSYIQTIFNTCAHSTYQFIHELFGGCLEWLDVEIGNIYTTLSIIITSIIIYKISGEKYYVPFSQKTIILCICVLILGLTFTSLYVQWTPVGSGFIGGLQGRYFLPILFTIPALAYGPREMVKVNNKNEGKNNYHTLLSIFIIFQSLAATIVIICSHIGAI